MKNACVRCAERRSRPNSRSAYRSLGIAAADCATELTFRSALQPLQSYSRTKIFLRQGHTIIFGTVKHDGLSHHGLAQRSYHMS
jgi:hypothetical protein